MNPYQKLLNRKRTWTPVQTTAGKLVEGAEETIYRALAIRHMELPVGDFITDALKNEVPHSSREISALTVRRPASPLKRKKGRSTKKIARSATNALRIV